MSSRSNRAVLRSLGVAAGIAAMWLLAGCSDSSAPRSVLTILSVNDDAPLSSDVVNYGSDNTPGTSDDYVLEDRVPIRIRSADHDDIVDIVQNGPFGYVFIDSYSIEFEGDEEIPAVSGGLAWTVPAHTEFVGTLPVVPAGLKGQPPLSSLVGGNEITATARITLRGHEQDSDAPVKLVTTLPVHFANWVDVNN